MKAAALILFVISLCAGDILDIGEVTDVDGIAISHCHPGDRALVEVQPESPNAYRVGGSFMTTNRLLTLKSVPMTMVPNGTNLARIRTICAGSTSEVTKVRFWIRRPVAAPQVRRGRALEQVKLPLPPGMVMALPGGDNSDKSYSEYRKRLDQAALEGRRRSQ